MKRKYNCSVVLRQLKQGEEELILREGVEAGSRFIGEDDDRRIYSPSFSNRGTLSQAAETTKHGVFCVLQSKVLNSESNNMHMPACFFGDRAGRGKGGRIVQSFPNRRMRI